MKHDMTRLLSLSCLLAPVASADPGGEAAPIQEQAWGDYDGDGLEDLYVLTPGAEDRLFKNLGDGGFLETTREAGLAAGTESRAALWRDVDSDGRLDLLLVTATGSLRYYRGADGGSLVDSTAGAGLEAEAGVLDAAWLDYDRDGLPDLELRTAAGTRLSHQTEGGRFEPVVLDLPQAAALSATGAFALETDEAEVEPRAPLAGSLDEPRASRRVNVTTFRGPTLGAGAGPSGPDNPSAGTGGPGTLGFQCFDAVKDQATGACLQASSIPALGMLFPISDDFYIDAANGRVGLGTTSPASPFHVSDDLEWTLARLSSGSEFGAGIALYNSHPSYNQYWEMRNLEGQLRFFHPGTSGNETVMTLTTDKRVGIGTEQPVVPLHVTGGTDTTVESGGFIVSGTEDSLNISLDENEIMARNNGDHSPLYLNFEGGVVNVGPGGVETPAWYAVVSSDDSVRGILARNSTSDSGFVQILDTNDALLAGLGGDNLIGGQLFALDNGVPTVLLDGGSGDSYIDSNSLALNASGGPVTLGGTLTVSGMATVGGTLTVNNDLTVDGNATVDVLTIMGGADIAEPFEVRDADAVEPGMVVAIDPARLGELRVADAPYDTTVAGIVSGAGGVDVGLTLRQEGTVADGTHPVALTGRVWCKVDADAGGPVEAGDLLTTSATPGHAMRVTDSERAQGAILGKAMSSLENGRGLVLVLVSLQ